MDKYVLVEFPENQYLMNHPRFNECILCQSIEGHECSDSTYAVPLDLYNEVYEEGIKEKDIEKAAQEYINSLPLLDDESEVLQIKRAFKAGSKWCITNNK